MSEIEAAPTVKDEKERVKYITHLLYYSYVLMLIFSICIFAVGIVFKLYTEVIIAVPVIIAMVDTIFIDRKSVHIPPIMVFMLMVLMIVILIGRIYFDRGILFETVIDILFGVILGLFGLMFTYSLIRSMPGKDDNRPFLIAFMSLSVGLTMFVILILIEYYITVFTDADIITIEEVMATIIGVIIGATLVSVLFYSYNHTKFFKETVSKYLESRAGTIDFEEYGRQEVMKAIRMGESENVEYKSTMRTNLATGEKDSRMEKAVLKTVVAFLNSTGGTLLIGVNDAGEIIGIDEEQFENRDKLNLHMTNLLASHIGNEYLPYISFGIVDFDGKGVMRIACKKCDVPVFLKEGKQETFFVRSGPSSIDINGTKLVNYVAYRFKTKKLKMGN